MKKKIFVLALVVLLVSFIGSLAIAAGPKDNSGPAGKSNKAHLYLYEIQGGAWGKMEYDQSGYSFDFVFNGHGLAPLENYTLVYYPNYSDLTCPNWVMYLGFGVANEYGDAHIQGSIAGPGDLPAPYDLNFGSGGAKIWLVLSEDVAPLGGLFGCMNELHLENYLFGNNLTFNDLNY